MGLGACVRGDVEESAAEGHQPLLAPAASCECASARPVVDPALLAFLSKAKSVHLQADMAEDDDKPSEAVKLLEDFLAGLAPGGDAPSPEVREVRADTLARLAELQSGLGQFDEAKKNVERGLGLATEITHYRGRLMEVLGVVEQRQHDALAAAGDAEGAKAAKERAIAALQKAVAIQDEVIRNFLGDAGSPEDLLK
jgi:tetratricopeptide (TPR) repeat protein